MGKYLSTDAIRKLSRTQRNFLLRHIDGPYEMDDRDRQIVIARNVMLGAKLVYGFPLGSLKPRKTMLTDAGRQAVCAILGEAADALVRAGLLEQENPIDALRRLQSLSRSADPATVS